MLSQEKNAFQSILFSYFIFKVIDQIYWLITQLRFQLGEVLGEDYERKMAVVAVLKQYAEDRDLDILCRSLETVLTSNNAKSILRYIR